MDNKYLEGFGLTCYTVGQKYDKVMPGDGAIFETHNNMCFCNIGLTDVTVKEITAVKNSAIELNICSVDGIVFICANIGNVLFFDMPFNMCLYKEFALKEPKSFGYLMPIMLVENKTNVIKAMRVICFDNTFSKKLYELSQQQWQSKIQDYDKRLLKVYEKYPASKLLDKSCAYFRTNDR